jgi:hypothetical protein
MQSILLKKLEGLKCRTNQLNTQTHDAIRHVVPPIDGTTSSTLLSHSLMLIPIITVHDTQGQIEPHDVIKNNTTLSEVVKSSILRRPTSGPPLPRCVEHLRSLWSLPCTGWRLADSRLASQDGNILVWNAIRATTAIDSAQIVLRHGGRN